MFTLTRDSPASTGMSAIAASAMATLARIIGRGGGMPEVLFTFMCTTRQLPPSEAATIFARALKAAMASVMAAFSASRAASSLGSSVSWPTAICACSLPSSSDSAAWSLDSSSSSERMRQLSMVRPFLP